MRKIVAGIAGGIAVTTGLALSCGTASARTVYEKYATIDSSGPPSDATCAVALYDHQTAAEACFAPYGDEFWMRDMAHDGHHVEMRAEVLSTADGFRCYTYRNPDVGWQKCGGWGSVIPEYSSISFTADVYEGSTLLNTSMGTEASTS